MPDGTSSDWRERVFQIRKDLHDYVFRSAKPAALDQKIEDRVVVGPLLASILP